jgi:hypothetical protein
VCCSPVQTLLEGMTGERWTGSVEKQHSQGGAQTHGPTTATRHGGIYGLPASCEGNQATVRSCC